MPLSARAHVEIRAADQAAKRQERVRLIVAAISSTEGSYRGLLPIERFTDPR